VIALALSVPLATMLLAADAPTTRAPNAPVVQKVAPVKAPALIAAPPKAVARAKFGPPHVHPAATSAPAPAATPVGAPPAQPNVATAAPAPVPAPAAEDGGYDEGRLLVERKCAKCHDVSLAMQSQLTDAEWKLHMKRMANRPSAAITDDQARRIHVWLKARSARP
jgi:cytochrome c5